ncbi:MAG: heavy-metal-associated domain-containing protein [Hymenobacteraceae bacterium]|nr:heavy-metal-associated domain-containing protein [Hymenobacteraceae bacterium]
MTLTLLRRASWTIVAAVSGLLLWANWQAPALHGYARPVTVATLRVEGVGSARQAVALERQVSAVPGITACTIQPRAARATLFYHPDETSIPAIQAAFARLGVRHVLPVRAAAVATGPQCPVPSSYVMALDRLRFVLNFRRFWVAV